MVYYYSSGRLLLQKVHIIPTDVVIPTGEMILTVKLALARSLHLHHSMMILIYRCWNLHDGSEFDTLHDNEKKLLVCSIETYRYRDGVMINRGKFNDHLDN
jgi:hypothetical protein